MNDKRKRKTMNRNGKWMMFYALIVLTAGLGFGQEQKDAFIKEYKIGAHDLLEIKVVEVPELNLTVRVSEGGSITLPLLGRVDLGGLTKDAVEQKIASMLSEKYVKNPQVTVFIREYQSNRLTLIGAVKTPGMYEIVGKMNLLELISRAGGFAENSGNELFVMRAGQNGVKEKMTIDLNDLILNGNPNLNIPLQPNDEIIVPLDKIIQVYVWGEVKSPGALSVKISKKITLLQAIAQAGGPTDSAKKSGVIIKRKDEKTGKEIQMTLNLNDIIKGKKPDPPLKEGDVVYVPVSFW
jgi:polysaccharide export outer membrane protein